MKYQHANRVAYVLARAPVVTEDTNKKKHRPSDSHLLHHRVETQAILENRIPGVRGTPEPVQNSLTN